MHPSSEFSCKKVCSLEIFKYRCSRLVKGGGVKWMWALMQQKTSVFYSCMQMPFYRKRKSLCYTPVIVSFIIGLPSFICSESNVATSDVSNWGLLNNLIDSIKYMLSRGLRTDGLVNCIVFMTEDFCFIEANLACVICQTPILITWQFKLAAHVYSEDTIKSWKWGTTLSRCNFIMQGWKTAAWQSRESL